MKQQYRGEDDKQDVSSIINIAIIDCLHKEGKPQAKGDRSRRRRECKQQVDRRIKRQSFPCRSQRTHIYSSVGHWNGYTTQSQEGETSEKILIQSQSMSPKLHCRKLNSHVVAFINSIGRSLYEYFHQFFLASTFWLFYGQSIQLILMSTDDNVNTLIP